MVSCVRMFIWNHHLGILSEMAWYVVFVALCMALRKPLVHGLSVLLIWSLLLVSLPVNMWSHYSSSVCWWRDDPEYIAFVKARLSEQFLLSYLGLLRYFLEIEIIVPLLLMSVLLRLLWSSIFLYMHLESRLSGCYSSTYFLSYPYFESVCFCSHFGSL
jgi:hypothetical protein